MPETAIAVSNPIPAQLQVSREWENQLELVKRTVAPGLTDEEFALFCHVARADNI